MPADQVVGGKVAKRSSAGELGHGQRVEVGRIEDQPGHHQLVTRSSPSPSMSMAEREA